MIKPIASEACKVSKLLRTHIAVLPRCKSPLKTRFALNDEIKNAG